MSSFDRVAYRSRFRWSISLLGYNSTLPLSGSNLIIDRIRFFSFCRPSISPLSTRLLGVRDRCHARLLLEHSAEGPLGYWWLIRHFASAIYIVAKCREAVGKFRRRVCNISHILIYTRDKTSTPEFRILLHTSPSYHHNLHRAYDTPWSTSEIRHRPQPSDSFAHHPKLKFI